MDADIEEQYNLQAEHTEVVQELEAMLKEIVNDGRSTPGRKLKKDIENIDIWKGISRGPSEKS